MSADERELARLRSDARREGVSRNDRLTLDELRLVFEAKDLEIPEWNRLSIEILAPLVRVIKTEKAVEASSEAAAQSNDEVAAQDANKSLGSGRARARR